MKQTMPFYDWIDTLNNANSDITQWGQSYPNTTFREIEEEEFQALVYRNWYNRLFNIVMKLFKWKLPDTMNERALEMGYITRGQVCVYKSALGEFALPCIANNRYNLYGDPTQANVFGFNGYQETVEIRYKTDIPSNKIDGENDDLKSYGVYSRDNDLTYPYIYYIKEYAYKLADKNIALYNATQRLKCPLIYTVSEAEMKDNVKDLGEKIKKNQLVIIRVKPSKISNSATDIVEDKTPQVNPSVIQAIKDSILFDFNTFLEIVGINTNPSPDKSQVVLTPELESNNSLLDLEQDIRFLNRKKLCDDVKSILGIEMSVEKNLAEVNKEINKVKGEFGNEDTTRKSEKTRQSL